jgi:hypothetical protein
MESRCAAITLERKAEELQIAGQFKNFRFAGWRLSMIVFRANLVEAGGVEPPSEKVRNEENYVRFRFKVVGWPP